MPMRTYSENSLMMNPKSIPATAIASPEQKVLTVPRRNMRHLLSLLRGLK